MEEVVLVDKNDKVLGFMEKIQAHREGLLHRAFSVFLFNSKNELLLQQRALSKYHSPGLWTNTCCSHPRENESTMDAANRRLLEEMGMECTLEQKHHFIYKVKLDQGMTEHELDHVFIGVSDQAPLLNKDEAASFKYMDLETCLEDVRVNPNTYTEWFKIALPEVIKLFNTTPR